MSYKNKHIDGYKIRYRECGCGWITIDVVSPEGQSVKDIIGLKVIEKMLHSGKSQVKING